MSKAPLNELVRNLRQTVEAFRLDSLSDADLLERFRNHTDAAAFETIVRRHGERVLAACRKVLSDSADVEDAFQATWRFWCCCANVPHASARIIRSAAWLYGVAHRIALHARCRAARRAFVEAKKEMRTSEDGPDLSWREACTILPEELDTRSTKYRLT